MTEGFTFRPLSSASRSSRLPPSAALHPQRIDAPGRRCTESQVQRVAGAPSRRCSEQWFHSNRSKSIDGHRRPRRAWTIALRRFAKSYRQAAKP